MVRALLNVGVCSDQFTEAYVIDPNGGHTYGYSDHALALWTAPFPADPDGKTCGEKALLFLHEHLD
jgi:hypothetical protein